MLKKFFIIVMMLALIIAFVGCGSNKGEEIGCYDDEDGLPKLMSVSGGNYYIFTGMYGDDNYKLSISDDPEKMNFVYETSDVSIWYLRSEGDIAAWTEKGDDTNRVCVYVKNKSIQTIEEIKSRENESQNSQMGIYKGKVYYNVIDYDKKQSIIKCFDVSNNKKETIHKENVSETPMGALEVKDGILIAYQSTEDSDKIYKKDLESGIEEYITIPQAVNAVYAVSYDKKDDLYAIYYNVKDSGRDNIGIFAIGDKKIKSLHTFADNEYAYRDSILFNKGHIYWTNQSNTSGFVDEHYTTIDYNTGIDDYEEYKSSFGFALGGEDFYTLSFYAGIDLVTIEKH